MGQDQIGHGRERCWNLGTERGKGEDEGGRVNSAKSDDAHRHDHILFLLLFSTKLPFWFIFDFIPF